MKPPAPVAWTSPAGTVWPLTADGRMLVLRTCDSKRRGYGGFQWPKVGGVVTAPDWDPDPARECGGGLHGLVWGVGNATMLTNRKGTRWLVVAVAPGDFANVDQPGKVRYRSAEVLLDTAERDEAIAYLVENGAQGLPVVWSTATAGDAGTATAGYRGTATAGGDGTATAGDYGTATAGYDGTATAGYAGTATAGGDGTATAGDYGTATAGDAGTSTAGDYGTATAGYYGTATAGYRGTATAGYAGTATAGDAGRLVVTWYDEKAKRYRITVGYVGEDGITEGTAYRCDPAGKLVEATR